MATEIVLKMAAAAGVLGGRAVVPVDGAGDRLPNVVAVTTESEAGEAAFVTIRLRVDGKSVRFE